jgi:hypothetical protein
MKTPSQRNSKRVKLGALRLTGTLLAVFLILLFMARGSRQRDLANQLGPVERLEESGITQSLQGQLLARLVEGSRATAIGFGPGDSIYVLMPDRQKVMRLDTSGNPAWTIDLRSSCECGFCVSMSTKPNGSVLLLDMRDDQICEVSSAGIFVRRFPLPGSDASVSFGIVDRSVLVNSLLGDSTLAAYDFTGGRLEFGTGPAWDTPEQKLAYVMPIEQGWVVVHRFSGIIRLLEHDGQPIGVFSNARSDVSASKRSAIYLNCSAGGPSSVWCLAPSGSLDTTVLQEIHFPAGHVTNYRLPGAFWSLAVRGRTAFVVSRGGDEIWEFELP